MNALVPLNEKFELSIKYAIENATHVVEEYNSYNSKISFDRDIKYLESWCHVNGILSLDHFKKEYLIYFIMDHVEKQKMSTIRRRIASLSRYLQLRKMDSPCYHKDIMILMRKLTEKYGTSKSWGKAITLDVLNDMLDTCKDDGIKGVRDAAVLLFGFSTGGRRRTEISNATMDRLKKNRDGSFTYNLGKSKTNQLGEDDHKPLVGRAAMALSYWLNESGITEGSIFRGLKKNGKLMPLGLSDKQIARIVKDRCQKAGYDPKDYTAHSLRSGFVTESGIRGKPLGDVMAMTGHKSMKEVMRYYKTGDIMNNSTAYLAG
jgi:integrase